MKKNNIVVLMPKFIGDSVMASTAIRLLHEKCNFKQITLLVNKNTVQLFEGVSFLKTVVIRSGGIGKYLDIVKALRSNCPEYGVLFHNSFFDALAFKLGSCATSIGYDNEYRSFLLNFTLKIHRARPYISHYCRLVQKYFQLSDELTYPDYLIGEKAVSFEARQEKKIGIIFGGPHKQLRELPTDSCFALIDLFKSLSNIELIFLGDHHDSEKAELCNEYARNSNMVSSSLAGETSIKDFVSQINSLDVLITIDTSALHIAAALKTPCVCLVGLGSCSFDLVRPLVKDCIVIKSKKLYVDEAKLMQGIDINDIYAAVKGLLN